MASAKHHRCRRQPVDVVKMYSVRYIVQAQISSNCRIEGSSPRILRFSGGALININATQHMVNRRQPFAAASLKVSPNGDLYHLKVLGQRTPQGNAHHGGQHESPRPHALPTPLHCHSSAFCTAVYCSRRLHGPSLQTCTLSTSNDHATILTYTLHSQRNA